MTEAASLLSVRDLRVGFDRGRSVTEVVHGISFNLRAGETLAIVGESGSGKSVTALSINRLIDTSGGRILGGAIEFRLADGQCADLATAPERQLLAIRGQDIGMVFQEPMTSLNPVHRIGSQIAEAFRLHQGLYGTAAMLAARRMLDRVRIPDAGRRLRYYPHQLSGGMRQRVMLAIAMACRPRLLIADEPTTALDVTIQAQIVALLHELRAETGMALIFISHDIGLIAGVADRLLVMQAGRAVEQGPLDQIIDRPQHPYTQHLIRAVPHFSHGRGMPPRRNVGLAQPVLAVRGLTVRFAVTGGMLRRSVGAVHAVEGVDFDLWPGETLAIVGESGSGKSTMARAILGLTPAARGTITLAAPQNGGGFRKQVQMVFQDPFASLNPRLTVKSLLAEPAIAAGLADDARLRARKSALLTRVGLPAGSLDSYPQEFSGGQRQRLCIARALMARPAILVLDEAVSALDVSIQSQVLDLLSDLQREYGLAYLFISHDIAVVERIAHRVAVMYAGEIVEIGDASAVLGHPAHSYTRRLIAAVPAIDRRHRQFQIDSRELPSLVRRQGFEPGAAVWRKADGGQHARVELPATAPSSAE